MTAQQLLQMEITLMDILVGIRMLQEGHRSPHLASIAALLQEILIEIAYLREELK